MACARSPTWTRRSASGPTQSSSRIRTRCICRWRWPRRVYAVGGHLSNLEVDVEDSVSLLLDCQSLPVQIHLDYLQRPPQRRCEIVGDAGRARYDYYANEVSFESLAGDSELHRFENF